MGGWLGDLGGSMWAVGAGGLVVGTKLSSLSPARWPAPAAGDLAAVAALRDDVAFAVGSGGGGGGCILAFNGSGWSHAPVAGSSGLQNPLLAVACGRTAVCIAVGEAATILSAATATTGSRAEWTAGVCPSCGGLALRAVWVGPLAVGDASSIAWAVGDRGSVVRWDYGPGGGAAERVAVAGLTADLLAVTATANGIFAAGRGGVVLWYVYGEWVDCGVPKGLAGLDVVALLSRPVDGVVWAGTSDGQVLELSTEVFWLSTL